MTRTNNRNPGNEINSAPCENLLIVSYNLQGVAGLDEIIDTISPDVFMVQEHWLTPANLCYFNRFTDYFMFGCSAMSSVLETGMLYGRPYGGVIMLINNRLRARTRVLHSAERYAIILIDNYAMVNVYLPCAGTANRLQLYDDILCEISAHFDQLAGRNLVVGGDFNLNFDSHDPCFNIVDGFCKRHCLHRCDDLFPSAKVPTYINEALKHSNTIDYILTSSTEVLNNFEVLDLVHNFSDHLPLLANLATSYNDCNVKQPENIKQPIINQLRWDRADLDSYYEYTRVNLQPIWDYIRSFDHLQCTHFEIQRLIDDLYNSICSVLTNASDKFVPVYPKHFFKYWWDQELNALKSASVEANNIWKTAGKPKHGAIFQKRQFTRAEYRRQLRHNQKAEVQSYSNDLHEALMAKSGPNFWKTWRSKFNDRSDCNEIDGHVNPVQIANSFRDYFSKLYTANNLSRAEVLHDEYFSKRQNYYGFPINEENEISTEVVAKIVDNLQRGKAAGLDGICAEHIKFSFPSLHCILSILFKLMLTYHYVPHAFCVSFTVPLPKLKDTCSKTLSCNDFRGIAISSVLSKVFEHSLLQCFGNFLKSNDNQFGFKKDHGCTHAIFTLRKLEQHSEHMFDRHIEGL